LRSDPCNSGSTVLVIIWIAQRKHGAEPCDATEPGLHGFTNGNSTFPAR
jgi:hypothetical protein